MFGETRPQRTPGPDFGRNRDLLSPKLALSEAERAAKSAKNTGPDLCLALGDLCVFARDISFFSLAIYADNREPSPLNRFSRRLCSRERPKELPNGQEAG
jgi:hypothetical protein